MKDYVVYDESGLIVRTGTCQDRDFQAQARDGQFVIEGHADDLTQMVVDGKVTDKPEPSDEEKTVALMAEIREIRSYGLSSSDWTQLPDSPLTAEQKSEWQMYRQKLRDLPNDYAGATTMEQVNFPAEPS